MSPAVAREPKESYADEWRTFTVEQKREIAGSDENAVLLDRIAERASDAQQRAMMLGDANRRLRNTLRRLRVAAEVVSSSRLERDAVIAELAILGVQKSVIAKQAGVSPMIVKYAVYGQRRDARPGRKSA